MAIETTVSPLAGLRDRNSWEDVVEPSEDTGDVEERRERPRSGALAFLVDQIDDINIARSLPQDELDTIGGDVVREYRIDENSRSEWCDDAEKAVRFASQKTTPKQYPWPGSANFIYPLIGQAALEFHARTYPAIVQNRNVVKGVVWGDDDGTPATTNGEPDGPVKTTMGPNGQPMPVWLIPPGEKRKRADRIGEHMSWQLIEEMKYWQGDTDQLLLQLPVIGGAARKTFYDPMERCNKSLRVSLMNLVWNYHASSFENVTRISEKILLYPHEITELERAETNEDGEGMFLPLEYGPGGAEGDGEKFNGKPIDSGEMADEDAPQLFIEQHRRLDLDLDGYAEPYIVTVHLRSGKVVRIVARYDEDGIEASDDGEIIQRIKPVEHYTLYPFLPNIDGGSYPMGFGHLLRALSEGINTTINQMFDSGHLQIAGGGFVSDQLNTPSGQTLFQVGKFHRVNTKGADIRAAIMPLPFPGPSQIMFQLMGLMVTAGEKMGGIGNILTGDAAMASASPTTILALIEQGMNFYTAVIKRVFLAEKSELDKLFRLNRLHITDRAKYKIGDTWREVTAEDYRLGGGVDPVADPKMTTDMQRLGRAQIVASQAKENPTLYDQREAQVRVLEAAGIDRIDDLLPKPDPQAAMQAQQMQMAMAQAQLGELRAKELKDQTQAFLNMALARKNANGQQEAFIDAQLTYLRLQIEATNAKTKAADVVIGAHGHALDVAHRYHQTHMDAAEAAAERAAQLAQATAPTPGPTGPFPAGDSAPPPGPDVVTPSSPGTGNTVDPGDVSGAGPSGPPAQTVPAI